MIAEPARLSSIYRYLYPLSCERSEPKSLLANSLTEQHKSKKHTLGMGIYLPDDEKRYFEQESLILEKLRLRNQNNFPKPTVLGNWMSFCHVLDDF